MEASELKPPDKCNRRNDQRKLGLSLEAKSTILRLSNPKESTFEIPVNSQTQCKATTLTLVSIKFTILPIKVSIITPRSSNTFTTNRYQSSTNTSIMKFTTSRSPTSCTQLVSLATMRLTSSKKRIRIISSRMPPQQSILFRKWALSTTTDQPAKL